MREDRNEEEERKEGSSSYVLDTIPVLYLSVAAGGKKYVKSR